MTEWISVKNSFPENLSRILIYTKNGLIMSATFKDPDQFFHDDDREYDTVVTHWTYLPQPPKD